MKFDTLFKYRTIWMGFAALSIMLYHSGFDIITPLVYFQRIGHGGVDIFLFASGIGCYFSYTKDHDYISFMKRRVKRILPTFLIFITIWIIYREIFFHLRISEIIGNISLTGYILSLENQFNWYISMVWFYYLAVPFICYFIKDASIKGKVLAILSLAVFSSAFYCNQRFLIFVCRIPIFILGCIFAYISKKKERISKKAIIAMIIGTVLGFVWIFVCSNKYDWTLFSIGFYWYPFFLITPGLCVMISAVADFFSRHKLTRYINSAFKWCGGLSLEIYMVHLWLYEMFNKFVKGHPVIFISLISGCFIVSYLLSLLVRLVKKIYVKADEKFFKKFQLTQ